MPNLNFRREALAKAIYHAEGYTAPWGDRHYVTQDHYRHLAECGLSALDKIPIPMVIFCPICGAQHIDKADPEGVTNVDMLGFETRWDNPPHRSHLCDCGHVWRTADVATVGVLETETRGGRDVPLPTRKDYEECVDEGCDHFGKFKHLHRYCK